MEQKSTKSVRVAIIGGGAAGIIAAKNLRELSHDVVVFEKSSHLGGIWKYDDAADAPSSVLYKSLHTNLPTSIMQLRDFPFQAGLPSYPSHADVLEYLQNYAKHFGVDEFVRTGTKVTEVSKVGDQWKISVQSKGKGVYDEEFDRLVVANGHFNKAWLAPIKGIENYPGVVSHARSYRTPEPYHNKRVLVVGRGPSGQDISLELAESGVKEVYVTALDYDPNFVDEKDTRILKPAVGYIAENGMVVFTDGSSIEAPDEIMHCTGYLYTVNDFFPSELLFPKTAVVPNIVSDEIAADLGGATTDGTAVAPVYKHVFSIEDPTAVFIGIPFSNLPFLCFELQAKWIARVFDGSVRLPSKEEMYEDFYETVRKIDGPARKLHSLSGLQKDYFTELGVRSGTFVEENIHDMYEDAAYLRVNFPHDFRSADFMSLPQNQFSTMSIKLQSVRVGIIGGGASGIITAKCLRDVGHEVVVFEKAGNVGGVWKYDEAADASSSVLYKSLHTNLPTAIMQLKEFPFQNGVPSFPSHVDVLTYLQNYSKHYEVDKFVRLNSVVTSLVKVSGQWKIGVSSKEKGDYEEEFDRVVVCNGHFSRPSLAPIKGIEHYKGTVSHSRSYRTPESYKGKRVVVIGRGPSGQDISLELVRSGAAEVIVATLDYDSNAIDPQDQRVLKPAIDHIAEDGSVVFTDGSIIASPDEILHCTGYLYTVKDFFPSELLIPKAFVQPNAVSDEITADLLQCTTNRTAVAPLYKQLFAIEDPTAAFIGLPFSNLPFLCFQLQARWIARVFGGSAVLPSKEDMYADFFAYLGTLKDGVRKLHQLGVRQKDYFTELAALSNFEVGEEIHEIYEDARFLRQNFPYNYRSAEFRQDEATGKWVRSIKSSDSASELVVEFSS
ncbi:hypothetical protein JG687_00003289 [Phytophthora cactorum]|uniref:Flavin-containing monooxygenase n=1 Tax=Phytophthora cactorum TaxID=29920 RepID=A0A8T1USS0_9STRA|nr:hypothetical protein JG687_00003289 [Phytophthora cactorum]